MYVLCTLAVLTLHSLLKSWNNKAVGPGGRSEGAGEKGRLEDGAVTEAFRPRGSGEDRRGPRRCRADVKRRRRGGGRNAPDSRRRVLQVRTWRSQDEGF